MTHQETKKLHWSYSAVEFLLFLDEQPPRMLECLSLSPYSNPRNAPNFRLVSDFSPRNFTSEFLWFSNTITQSVPLQYLLWFLLPPPQINFMFKFLWIRTLDPVVMTTAPTRWGSPELYLLSHWETCPEHAQWLCLCMPAPPPHPDTTYWSNSYISSHHSSPLSQLLWCITALCTLILD